MITSVRTGSQTTEEQQGNVHSFPCKRIAWVTAAAVTDAGITNRKGGRAPQIGCGVCLSPEQEYKYSWSGAAESESAPGLRYVWLPLPVPERGLKCFEDPRCRVGSAARLNRSKYFFGSAWLKIRSGGNLWSCNVWQQVRSRISIGNGALDDCRQWIPIKVRLPDALLIR